MTALLQAPPEQLAAPRRLRALAPALVRDDDAVTARTSNGSLLAVTAEPPELPPNVARAHAMAQRHPDSPAAWARLAQAELMEHRLAEAADAAQAALSSAGFEEEVDAAARLSATVTLAHCGRGEEAERALLLPSDQQGPAAILAASLAAQRRQFGEALERLGEEESGLAWNLRGWVALHQADWRAAVRAYRQAIASLGPTPESLTNLGVAHAALGNLGKAVKATQQALALNPSRRDRVVFNLAAYLISAGDGPSAIAAVDQLVRDAPTAEAAFVLGRLHLGLGQEGEALRVLRRARTRLWAQLDRDTGAELDANIAFVRGQLGELEREAVASELIRAIQRTEFASLRIASLLPQVLNRFSNTKQLRAVVARVREQNPQESLLELETHLAILERRFESASAKAVEWAEQSFLDPEPAALAVLLLCDIDQDYARAVELGAAARERMPAAHRLAHNVGYALALNGHLDPARRCLGDPDQVPVIATHALVELRAGAVADALALYRRALKTALGQDDARLAILVDLHARFALARFAEEAEWDSGDELVFTDSMADDPAVAIAVEMLRRGGVGLPEYLAGWLDWSD